MRKDSCVGLVPLGFDAEILLDTEQKKNLPKCKETVSLEDFLVKTNIEIDEKSKL